MKSTKDFVWWLLYVWAYIIGAAGVYFIAGLPVWITLFFLYWAIFV